MGQNWNGSIKFFDEIGHEREGYANQKWGYPLNIHPISKEERQM